MGLVRCSQKGYRLTYGFKIACSGSSIQQSSQHSVAQWERGLILQNTAGHAQIVQIVSPKYAAAHSTLGQDAVPHLRTLSHLQNA